MPNPWLSRGNFEFPRPRGMFRKGELVVLDPAKNHSYTASANCPISKHRVGEVAQILDGTKPIQVRSLRTGLASFFGY